MNKKEIVDYFAKLDDALTDHALLGRPRMTPREKIQLSYEVAFYPPRLNFFTGKMRTGSFVADKDFWDVLDDARRLHLALPSKGYGSHAHLSGWRFIRRVPELIGCPILSMPSARRWGGWQYRKTKCHADSFEMSLSHKTCEAGTNKTERQKMTQGRRLTLVANYFPKEAWLIFDGLFSK